jgi:beta-lactam-binding protein with PASTA domain
MGFFYFLKKGKFYLHLLIAIVLSVFLLWVAIMALDIYTRHGKVYLIPDFTGQTLEQLKENGYDEYFDLIVIDSVYDNKREKGSVVLQNPAEGAKVKKGRHVYLTVVAQMPEKVIMPNLKQLSVRQAIVKLKTNGLVPGRLNYTDADYRNSVIEQYINDEPVEPGTEITKGTVVDLDVANGLSDAGVKMPFLIGKTVDEAHDMLHTASLNVGEEYFLDEKDLGNARVFKTDPEFNTKDELPIGSNVNIWYRSDQLFDFDAYIKELTTDTINADTNAVINENEIDEDF